MRRIIGAIAVLLMSGCLGSAATQAEDESCLSYSPSVVTLTGKITTHMEYGAPNYGQDPAHDEKLWYWYLDLDKPICMRAGNDDSYNSADADLRRLQILYKDFPRERARWLKHHVSITGELLRRDAGRHFTRVLMDPKKTERMSDGVSFLSR